jgi:hypothetical protein
MAKSDKKKPLCSVIEFQKKYFPKSFKKQISEEPKDARNIGISWAKESIDKIKDQLEGL